MRLKSRFHRVAQVVPNGAAEHCDEASLESSAAIPAGVGLGTQPGPANGVSHKVLTRDAKHGRFLAD